MKICYLMMSTLVSIFLALSLAPQTTLAGVGAPEAIVEDGDWAFRVSGQGMESWLYTPGGPESATTHLEWQSYWYRLDDDPAELNLWTLYYDWDSFTRSAANNLSMTLGKNASVVDPSSPYYDDTGYSLSDPLGVKIDYELFGGTDPNHSMIQQTISITNLRTESINLSLYEYTDFNLEGTESDVSSNLIDPRTIRQTGESLIGELRVLGTPDKTPDSWEINTTSQIVNALNDDDTTQLANQNKAATQSNVDFDHAFQWAVSLEKGAVFSITQEWEIFSLSDPVPPGSTSSNPLLPDETVQPGQPWIFNSFEVSSGRFTWLDPEVAIGYDYEILDGPNFESVLLPTGIGDDKYSLYLFNVTTGNYFFFSEVFGGEPFNFLTIVPEGLSKFRILGIEENAGLDPLDPTAFVTGLTFVNSGTVNMTMTPITSNIPSSTVIPEPATMILMGVGLAGMGFVRRFRIG